MLLGSKVLIVFFINPALKYPYYAAYAAAGCLK